MKRILLFAFLLTMVAGLSAQKVVCLVNSPASIAGDKVFVPAGFGADLSTGTWTADAVLAEPLLACSALTNAAAMAGKIALIERGTCNFDQKCLNAQNAGAIGVVVMNHNVTSNRGGAPYVMGVATASIASQVTIPCVMVGYDNNVALKAAVAAGVVNITLGVVNKQENDLAMYTKVTTNYTEPYIFNSSWGAIPVGLLRSDDDFPFQPGGFFTNIGSKDQTNVNLKANITKGAASVFTHTTADNITVEVDSTRGLLNDVFVLNKVSGNRVGSYQCTYNVFSGGTELLSSDNVLTSSFDVSNNLLCKSRVNTAAKAPLANQYWGGGTGFRELLSPFLLKYGKGVQIDSIFSEVASNEPLAGLYIEGRLYRWNDLNADNDIQNDEMETVAIGSYTFPGTASGNFGTIRVGLEDLNTGDPFHTVTEDGRLYFAAITYQGGANSLFNAYDAFNGQRQYFNLKDGLQELGFQDWPYISVRSQDAVTGGPNMDEAGLFYIDDNGDATAQDEEVCFFAPSIAVQMTIVVNNKDISNEIDVNIKLTPNPVKDQLIAEIKLPEATVVNYQIIDAQGHLVFNKDEKNAAKDINTTFNLSGLSSGQYFLKVNTPNGFVKKAFTKVN